jgi:hypothetical protein
LGCPTDWAAMDREFGNNVGIKVHEPEVLFKDEKVEQYLIQREREWKEILLKPTAIIFVGMAGAGKTTFAKKYFNNCFYINQDTLGTRIKVIKMIKKAVENGQSFVVDTTNGNKREEYYELLTDEYQVLVIYFVRNGYGWNSLRDKPVPKIAYYVFYKHFIHPEKDKEILGERPFFLYRITDRE